MLQCGALESANKGHHSRLSITSARVTSNADGPLGRSLGGLASKVACRKSVPPWLRGTIVHLQRAGLTMKTILVPTQNTPTMQSTLETAVLLAQRTGAYIEGVPRRSACLESATSRNIFYYFAIRQANS